MLSPAFPRKLVHCALCLFLILALGACGGSSSDFVTNTDDGANNGTGGGGVAGQTFMITPGPDATDAALLAFIAAGPGDVIQFACGFFDMTTGLVLQSAEGVTIKGCGKDETVISFRNSDTVEGILAINARGITIQDLTVVDTPGDGIKVLGSNFVTYRNVRAMWSSGDNPVTADNIPGSLRYDCPATPLELELNPPYQPSSENGRYALYPVESKNILMDNVEALGASDAGVYVGQSDDVIVRNSRALFNVAGFEIENTDRADMHDNVAECNTGGFLIFDLENHNHFGDKTRMFNNLSRNNNVNNFAAGGIVRAVPRGLGSLILAYDEVEVFDNEIRDHDTASLVIVSYELIGGSTDRRLDMYPEGISIHDNLMVNGGGNPALPNEDVITSGGENVDSLLPTLIRVKNPSGPFGAHVVWDGLMDTHNPECPRPKQSDGSNVPTDEKGEPQITDEDPNPDCRYDDYKFDDEGNLIKPTFWLCIEENNTFQNTNVLVPNFLNFKGAEDLTPLSGSNDIGPHQCGTLPFGSLPPLPPAELEEFTLSAEALNRPSDEEILEICESGAGGDRINRAALKFDCPLLSHYNLFSDPEDPRSGAHEGGQLFDLTTQLFSDYAVKYRFIFLPPDANGNPIPAQWRSLEDGENETILFPTGTVIAKTFAFPDTSTNPPTENVVETRLLIKRSTADGDPFWDGFAYIWETDDQGNRIARLALAGGEAGVNWHYNDPNTGELYTGSTDSYAIPHANQCTTCHGNTDRTSGDAPIGPKLRFLNRPLDYPGGTQNQLQFMRANGMLVGGPGNLGINAQHIATNVERQPIFNVPGDSGFAPNSPEDIEARARSYLEDNCAHCHNMDGTASNSGLFLDIDRPVNRSYGICKTPTAAGGGAGGRSHDIVPTDASRSIMEFRMNSNDPEERMPSLSRSVVHEQGLALIRQWINDVVDGTYEDSGCEEPGGGLGLPLP